MKKWKQWKRILVFALAGMLISGNVEQSAFLLTQAQELAQETGTEAE